MNLLVELIGWIGAVSVLGAYALLSAKKLTADHLSYHGLNMLGATCLAFYALYKEAWASVAVNFIWLGIGLVAVTTLARVARLRKD